MNNVCPNCGIIGPNFSCPNHTYCWGTGNTPSPTIQPQVTWMPVSDQLNNSSLFAEIGRLNVLLNERDKEIERLQHDVADLQMLRDEHQMDVMHAFQEGGEDDRRKVVAHLRERAIHGAGNTVTVEDACTILADLFERGEHLRNPE